MADLSWLYEDELKCYTYLGFWNRKILIIYTNVYFQCVLDADF